MIGLLASSQRTFIVEGTFDSDELIEGHVYIEPNTKRLYYYSKTETRSSPANGYLPCWNGSNTFSTPFSITKTESDIIKSDIESLADTITAGVADDVDYRQRRAEYNTILRPTIRNGDNMFTQCVKVVINMWNLTIIDLVDMSRPPIDQHTIENYYSSLMKINFMRYEKWVIWVANILHIRYTINVYDEDDNRLISYKYPENEYDTGIVSYEAILSAKRLDPLKAIVRVLIVMKGITKSTFKNSDLDEYLISNLFTTIQSNKTLSAQLFSRFIRVAGLSFDIELYDNDSNKLFIYKE